MGQGYIALKTTEIADQQLSNALEVPPRHRGWHSLVSQRSVKAIAIAPKSGVIWMATWGGVLAWDRDEKKFYRRYSSEHGLAGNAVSCLCIDRADRPWAGHLEGGLSCFENQMWQVHPELRADPIRAITAGSGDDIYAATRDDVYHVFGLSSGSAKSMKKVNEIEADAFVDADALLAHADGVLVGNAWGLYYSTPDSLAKRIGASTIRSCTALARDADERVWIGAADGVYRLEGDQTSGPITPDGSSERIVGLAAGHRRVWVWTTRGLAYIEDDRWHSALWTQPSGSSLERRTYRALPVRAIAPSETDSFVWIGTDEHIGGASSVEPGYVMPLNNLLPPHPDDRISNLGRCVARDDSGKIWIGASNGAAACAIRGTVMDHYEIGDVQQMVVAQDGDRRSVWALAWPAGLMRLSEASQFEAWNPTVEGARLLPQVLTTGREGVLHTLTAQGLWRLDSITKPKQVAAAPRVSARCLVQTADDTWWLGTTRGVYQYTSRSDGWEFVGERGGPREAGVYAMITAHDALWVATELGLWTWHNRQWQRHIVDREHPESGVRAIGAASQAQAVWLARDDGVVCFHSETGPTQAFTPYEHGLASRRVSALLEADSVLWIVTQSGINQVNLNDL